MQPELAHGVNYLDAVTLTLASSLGEHVSMEQLGFNDKLSVEVSEVIEPFMNWVKGNQERLSQEKMRQLLTPQPKEIPFYAGKVTEEVYNFFLQQGFREAPPFILLPDYIAYYYLSLCAAKAAQVYKSDSLTDEKNFTDIIFGSSPLVAEVATAVIKAYLPEDLSILEPSRIKDLRADLSVEKLKFQAKIQSLVDKYGKVSSAGQYEKVQTDIIDLAKDQVERVKQTFKQSRQKLVLKTFSLSLTPPALVTSVTSLLGLGIVAPIGIAAALSLFTAAAFIEWNEAKSIGEESPWSYILNIEKMKLGRGK